MGYYTEAKINLSLKEDTPKEVISALKYLEGKEELSELPDHEFFRCRRHQALIQKGAPYRYRGAVYETYDWGQPAHYEVESYASLKDYDNEIRKFCDWIRPWVGYGLVTSLGEEFHIPIVELAVGTLRES